MSLISWIKEHFELLAAGAVGIFGAGGIVRTQHEHGRKIEKFEAILEKDVPEIKGDIKTLLERTKHL